MFCASERVDRRVLTSANECSKIYGKVVGAAEDVWKSNLSGAKHWECGRSGAAEVEAYSKDPSTPMNAAQDV